MFDDKLRAIENDAKWAIQTNNLEEAKKVKEQKEKVEKLVLMAWDLEYWKSQAIEDEDYDSAKILKSELELVMRQLMSGGSN